MPKSEVQKSVEIVHAAFASADDYSSSLNRSIGTPEVFIGKREVAQRLKKTQRSVDNWMQLGILPYYKVGRSVLFRWSEIEAHLAQTCRVTRRN